tara:strand:+ start:428 stop:754 length:327 start_codon:yes stop_codon:yes gene_type:complete
LFRQSDYAAADIPMMPVVVGEKETKRQMLIYTAFLIPATLSPLALGMSGICYGLIALGLGVELWRRLWRVWKSEDVMLARPLFLFSIIYLFAIFVALLADRIVFIPLV